MSGNHNLISLTSVLDKVLKQYEIGKLQLTATSMGLSQTNPKIRLILSSSLILTWLTYPRNAINIVHMGVNQTFDKIPYDFLLSNMN